MQQLAPISLTNLGPEIEGAAKSKRAGENLNARLSPWKRRIAS